MSESPLLSLKCTFKLNRINRNTCQSEVSHFPTKKKSTVPHFLHNGEKRNCSQVVTVNIEVNYSITKLRNKTEGIACCPQRV